MKVKASKRISNGNDAEGPIPWQVAVYKRIEHWLILGCGASIIDENTILTAAHCFEKEQGPNSKIMDAAPEKYFLILGLLKNSEAYTKTRYQIEKIVIHPKYNPKELENDIAILKTKKQIEFTSTIQPICLPSKKDLPIGLISH